MNKPRGGRGKKNDFDTITIRIPKPLKERISKIVDRFYECPQVDNQEFDCQEIKDAIIEIVTKHCSKEHGYRTNSFGTGIKTLKKIFNGLV